MGITARQHRIVAGRSAFSSGLLQNPGRPNSGQPLQGCSGLAVFRFPPKDLVVMAA
jgi:hypothetical protein